MGVKANLNQMHHQSELQLDSVEDMIPADSEQTDLIDHLYT